MHDSRTFVYKKTTFEIGPHTGLSAFNAIASQKDENIIGAIVFCFYVITTLLLTETENHRPDQ